MQNSLKILVILNGLGIGGTNKSLQNIIGVYLRPDRFSVEILSLSPDGFNKSLFENSLITIPWYIDLAFCNVRRPSKLWRFGRFLTLIFVKAFSILGCNFYHLLLRIYSHYLSINKFDYIFSFSESYATYLLSQLPHANKIAWIRSDYERYLSLCGNPDEYKIYRNIEKIVCVSEHVAKQFNMKFPNLANRTYALHNLIDSDRILTMADNKIEVKETKDELFTLISIGRFDPVKRFNLIPLIAHKLISQGLAFRWFVIGTGSDDSVNEFLKDLKHLNLGDVICYLGGVANPYPYIKKSNLVVVLSSSESCPNVINEARILHKPILTTDFPSVYEFVNPSIGEIASVDVITSKLEKFINDREYYHSKTEGYKDFSYDNSSLISKLDLILEINT